MIEPLAGSFAFYAPKVHRLYEDSLHSLYNHDPSLHRPFKNSVYPAASFNLGPETTSLVHIDSGNFTVGMCALTSFGSFDPKLGGHLILWDLKIFVEFPPGATILILSAVLRHGNTPIQPGETRYSMTQYCAGGLLRWVAYGFRKVADLCALPDGELLKAKIDGSGNAGWKWAAGLVSKAKELHLDHELVREVNKRH